MVLLVRRVLECGMQVTVWSRRPGNNFLYGLQEIRQHPPEEGQPDHHLYASLCIARNHIYHTFQIALTTGRRLMAQRLVILPPGHCSKALRMRCSRFIALASLLGENSLLSNNFNIVLFAEYPGLRLSTSPAKPGEPHSNHFQMSCVCLPELFVPAQRDPCRLPRLLKPWLKEVPQSEHRFLYIVSGATCSRV